MYTGAALSFGLIQACRRGLVLYSTVLSHAGGENGAISAISEKSLLHVHVHDEYYSVITLRPRQNGRQFPDDILKCILLNENVRISIKISLNFVPKGSINNIPPLVQIMAWRRPGDKPLPEPMMDSLLTHICVTRPRWVILNLYIFSDYHEHN